MEFFRPRKKFSTAPHSLVLLLVAVVYGLAWFIQGRFFLNGDVSYCLHAASLLMRGGTYARDFFNPNPPLILYLQFPVLQFHQWLNGSLLNEARVYIFLLASLSLCLCYPLAQYLFQRRAFGLFTGFIATLAALFLIFPLYHFGEREHLLLMFTLPYFLLLACRLQPDFSPRPFLAFLIGLLAALGFALKPPFLLAPLFIELYYLSRQKRLFSCLRVETVTLAVFLAGYVLSIFSLHPDFIFLVLPFVLRNYYQSVSDEWPALFLNPASLFCYSVLLFYFTQFKALAEQKLGFILMLAMSGFLLAYFSQQTTFFYHALPALALAVLLLALTLGTLISQPKPARNQWRVLLGLVLLACLLPLSLQNYAKGREYKEQVLDKLTRFLQTQKPGRSLYVFARWGSYAFPVNDYSASLSVQRFDCLWPVLAFVKAGGPLENTQQQRDKDFFIEMIAEDFRLHRPDVVLVDQKDSSLLAWDGTFDYVDYFSQNPRFREEWKTYHYLTTLDNYPLYQLVVYQRTTDSPL